MSDQGLAMGSLAHWTAYKSYIPILYYLGSCHGKNGISSKLRKVEVNVV